VYVLLCTFECVGLCSSDAKEYDDTNLINYCLTTCLCIDTEIIEATIIQNETKETLCFIPSVASVKVECLSTQSDGLKYM